jgi:hypothetical protein
LYNKNLSKVGSICERKIILIIWQNNYNKWNKNENLTWIKWFL